MIIGLSIKLTIIGTPLPFVSLVTDIARYREQKYRGDFVSEGEERRTRNRELVARVKEVGKEEEEIRSKRVWMNGLIGMHLLSALTNAR